VTDEIVHEWVAEESDAGQRADHVIVNRLPGYSRTRIQKLIEGGHVLINGSAPVSSRGIHSGDVIRVVEPPPESVAPKPEDIALDVVYEDDDLLVINKAAGMVVHPGRGVSTGTLVNALLGRPHAVSSIGGFERPGIVHRLDKDTTGLMIVAKNDEAHIKLSEDLQARKIIRLYVALALRKFETDRGTIETMIGRNHNNRLKMMVREGADARQARTHWRIVNRLGGISQIECKLDTGRTHQIRVHMAHINHPILGDELYGGTAALATQLISPYDTQLRAMIKNLKRQMLHAHEIKFAHPRTGEILHFKAAPPRDYQIMLDRLRREVE